MASFAKYANTRRRNGYVLNEQSLLSSLPSNWTYTRADTVATYRDSAGEMRLGASNTARFNYTKAGVALGLLYEGTRINRCTNHNATPAATTNVTVTGTATVTLVADATAISNEKLGNVVTGNVFQLAGGASGGTAIITGATGATGACSASLYARDVVSSGASFGITPAPTAKAISGGAYARYLANNLTATATTDQMVITIPAGVTINFILNQLELGAFASTPIKTAGATATRQNCRVGDTAINTRGFFGNNMSEGAIIIEGDTYDIGNHGATFAYLSDNNDNTSGDINSIGHRMITGRAKTDSQYNYYGPTPTNPFGGSFDQLSIDKAGEGELARITGGFSWRQGGEINLYANSNFKKATLGNFTKIPDRLYIGSNVFTGQFFGHIRKVYFFNKALNFAQAGAFLSKSTDKFSLCSGQSNMEGWFGNSSGSTNGGEQVAVSTTDAYWSTTRNFCINGATNGTSVRDNGSGPNSTWINMSNGTRGTPFLRWLEIATGIQNKTNVKFLIDTSGESDAGNCTKAEYKAAQLEKFRIMQEALGRTSVADYIPVMLINLGRESTLNYAGYQTIAEAGIELARDNSWIHYIERIDISKSGTIHIDDAGCQVLAARTIAKAMKVLGETVTGGVDGPQITAVSRSGATVTVTITHDTGATDFTPSSSIAGFHFFNSNNETSEISITNAVRTNATTITLTLASTPAGTNQELFYGYRSLQPEDATIANLVKDNGVRTLPLRRARFTSTNTGASFASAF